MKTVLVTGAASGFGRGVALGLARRGHKVIAGCQIWPQVWELRQAAVAEDLDLQVVKLDVLNEMDRAKAFEQDIDVLFNNAGIMESGPMVEIPLSVVRS
ncbi:MAG: SDR family NAD(P)-dependent oxidoreductase, partial [Brevundimonas sp.]